MLPQLGTTGDEKQYTCDAVQRWREIKDKTKQARTVVDNLREPWLLIIIILGTKDEEAASAG